MQLRSVLVSLCLASTLLPVLAAPAPPTLVAAVTNLFKKPNTGVPKVPKPEILKTIPEVPESLDPEVPEVLNPEVPKALDPELVAAAKQVNNFLKVNKDKTGKPGEFLQFPHDAIVKLNEALLINYNGHKMTIEQKYLV